MKKASVIVIALFSFFAFVAPAAAQEKSWRIPGIGGQIKLQSPIRSSPRPRVTVNPSNTATTNGTNSAQEEQTRVSASSPQNSMESEIQAEVARELAARRRNDPNKNVGTDTSAQITQQENSGITLVEDLVIIPPDAKQEVPSLKGMRVGIELHSGYNQKLATEIQKIIAKRGGGFAKLPLGGDTSCLKAHMGCVVVYHAKAIGERHENGSTSWYGENGSSFGSGNSSSIIYVAPVSFQVLTTDGKLHLIGSTTEQFDVPRHVSTHSSNTNRGSRGGNDSSGSESVNYDEDAIFSGAAAEAAKNAVNRLFNGGWFSSGKGNWEADAAELVRQEFQK